MDNLSFLLGLNAGNGGGGGSTPSWSDVTDKPFSTVGLGLTTTQQGALQEEVPLYHETGTQQITENHGSGLRRQYTIEYTNEFYDYAEWIMIAVDNTYSGSCEISFSYWSEGNQITLSRSTVQDIHNDGTEVFTDSDGLRWHFYFTNDGYFHLTCIDDNYDGLDLTLNIYYPQAEYAEYGSSPTRTELYNYTNVFKGGIEGGSHLAIATSSSISWTWYEGEGYSLSEYSINITDWDWTDNTEVYTDTNGTTWHLYMEEDLTAMMHYVIYAEALDTLPAGTESYGRFSAEYIPIDNNTIQVDYEGRLYANVPSSGVQSVWYNDYQSGAGTQIGDLYVDGNPYGVYAPTVPTDVSAFNNDSGYITDTALTPYITSTDLSTALTPYAESSSLATVATSGDYSDLLNAPTIPVISATSTLATGTQIGEIEIDGATTTFYAPASASGVTPNWNAGYLQDGYIANKPSLYSGTGNYAIRLSNSGDASGFASTAIGTASSAKQDNQVVRGKFNIQNDNNQTVVFADIIGNGTSASRSNAEATDWSGNKYLAGDIYVSVTDWADPQNNAIKLANIPAAPTTTAGTLTLQATVDGSGNVTYAWV